MQQGIPNTLVGLGIFGGPRVRKVDPSTVGFIQMVEDVEICFAQTITAHDGLVAFPSIHTLDELEVQVGAIMQMMVSEMITG
jgi:hypothetical protein